MKTLTPSQHTALRGLALALVVVLIVAWVAFVTGCASIEGRLRKLPQFDFETWTHSDRYALLTDNVTISGVAWKLNDDGSATLTVDLYDGSAAWAGTVGPHDTIRKLRIHFPAGSAQAKTLATTKLVSPPSP